MSSVFDLRLICATAVFFQNTATSPSPLDILRQIRLNKTTKDADLVIKMTQEFIKDMRQKMIMVKRVQRTYQSSSDYATGVVYKDILSKFDKMCDLYKKFATVKRYILGYELNQTMHPNPDVVVIYQYMISYYDEIDMLVEDFIQEQGSWKEGQKHTNTRDLIQKQLLKFGNLPSTLTPPQIERKKEDPKLRRRWAFGEKTSTPRRWSGELEGAGFKDNEK